MNDIQKMKRNFRNSKAWKEFKKKKKEEQGKYDPITGGKLSRTANLHHRDLDEDHYTDISCSDNFVLLNHNTHEFLHWLYRYYQKDPVIIERIEKELKKWK